MKTMLSLTLILIFAMLMFRPNGLAQDPSPEYVVRVIYFVPKGSEPQTDIDKKLNTMIKDSQKFYAEMMHKHGFGEKTFEFETNENDEAVVHHITGQFADEHYIDNTGNKVLKEVGEQFDVSKNIYFIAINISNAGLNNKEACGLGTMDQGGGWILIPDRGRCFNVSVAAHELGHAFGLMHDYRLNRKLVPSSYTSDPMIRSFCAAEWLNVHRYFNPEQQTPYIDNTNMQMLPSMLVSEPNRIRLRFEITDPDGLHQVQLLTPEATYSGGFLDCKRINGTDIDVEFETNELTPTSTSVELRVIDVVGNIGSHSFSIDITSLFPSSKVISMPDVNLASAVRKSLNLAPNTVLTSHMMLKLTHLNAPNSEITDITGLEHALNLKELWLGADPWRDGRGREHAYISSNAISDLSPIEKLPKLYWMMLANPSVDAVAALPKLKKLRNIQIYNPPILDSSVIAELTQLRVLQIHHPSTPDVSALVSALVKLTQLEVLTLEGIPISDVDLSMLSNLTQLRTLDVEGHFITDILPLAKLTQLTKLSLLDTSVSDISPLAKLTEMRWLDLYNSPITDISPLAELTHLDVLYMHNCSISDISPLAKLTQLRDLQLSWNNFISDISPLAELTQLNRLNLTDTAVSDISPIMGLMNLMQLQLRGAPLNNISIQTHIPAMQARGVTVFFDKQQTHRVLLTISEIMVASNNGSLPQWIELHNRSDKPVNIKNWTISIRNRRTVDFEGAPTVRFTLKNRSIEPQETLLIVSMQGRVSKHFRDEQIYNLNTLHPNLQDTILSEDGFYLKLNNESGILIDEVGNLYRKSSNNDKPIWTLPIGETNTGARYSMIRRYSNSVPRPGTVASGWINSKNTKLITSTTHYYGHPHDIGAPGVKSGGALPVQLSYFRAAHTDAGIILNWTTESEVDNAGFFIYRSPTRDGKFKVVNPTIIQGAGTTGERNEYTWTDTTVKPNTVYYYRIEDVSHAGERKQLATVRLRGLVSASGKFTTTWADLKMRN